MNITKELECREDKLQFKIASNTCQDESIEELIERIRSTDPAEIAGEILGLQSIIILLNNKQKQD